MLVGLEDDRASVALLLLGFVLLLKISLLPEEIIVVMFRVPLFWFWPPVLLVSQRWYVRLLLFPELLSPLDVASGRLDIGALGDGALGEIVSAEIC